AYPWTLLAFRNPVDPVFKVESAGPRTTQQCIRRNPWQECMKFCGQPATYSDDLFGIVRGRGTHYCSPFSSGSSTITDSWITPVPRHRSHVCPSRSPFPAHM